MLALAPNIKNGNTLEADTISNELENVKVAIKILPDREKAPIGHQFVQCHMVLNIEMANCNIRSGLWQETT